MFIFTKNKKDSDPILESITIQAPLDSMNVLTANFMSFISYRSISSYAKEIKSKILQLETHPNDGRLNRN